MSSLIISKYVKAKVKGRSYSDAEFRKYIDDLLSIERLVLVGKPGSKIHWGYASSMHFHMLREKYPVEWKEIYKELDPNGLEKHLAWEKEAEAEEKKFLEEAESDEKEHERAMRAEWHKHGGTD